ncbi:MAG: hypothetical protein JSR37_02385 [Verrucomicrobia bacterium]|nr:hypothetical protein [Verrucomicrobiota bacterium]MBS0637849.1 hypothetical protein [Verrucomicrobiota bacterium]
MEPVLRQMYDSLVPYVQQGYTLAQPYVYSPRGLAPTVVTSGFVATLGGHAVTRIFGDTVGIASSMALAYTGAEMMHSESTKALMLAAAVHLAPSIFKKVVSDVISGTILGAGSLAVSGVGATLKYSFSVLTGTSRAESAKIKELQEKIEKLKTKKIELLAKLAAIKEAKEAKKAEKATTTTTEPKEEKDSWQKD